MAINKYLCNDGTSENRDTEYIGRMDVPCRRHGGIALNGMYTNNVTRTPVLCKDGTTKVQSSSPTAEYADACMNNGGIDNQGRPNTSNEVTCVDGTKDVRNGAIAPCEGRGGVKTTKNNTKEPIFYILVIAVVFVAGYFAYKKFKK